MGSPILSVVMLLGGLALAARSIQASPGSPSGGFYVSLILCGVSVFMLVRALKARRMARSLRDSSLTMREAMERWRTKDTDGLYDPPARRWGGAYGSGLAVSAGYNEFREAARALLVACDEDPQKPSRSRSAVRSACRRTHLRGAVPSPQPKRRRVRPLPRLFT